MVGLPALADLHLVLHLSEEQAEQVSTELMDHKFFGWVGGVGGRVLVLEAVAFRFWVRVGAEVSVF